MFMMRWRARATDPDEVMGVLNTFVGEIRRRYGVFLAHGAYRESGESTTISYVDHNPLIPEADALRLQFELNQPQGKHAFWLRSTDPVIVGAGGLLLDELGATRPEVTAPRWPCDAEALRDFAREVVGRRWHPAGYAVFRKALYSDDLALARLAAELAVELRWGCLVRTLFALEARAKAGGDAERQLAFGRARRELDGPELPPGCLVTQASFDYVCEVVAELLPSPDCLEVTAPDERAIAGDPPDAWLGIEVTPGGIGLSLTERCPDSVRRRLPELTGGADAKTLRTRAIAGEEGALLAWSVVAKRYAPRVYLAFDDALAQPGPRRSEALLAAQGLGSDWLLPLVAKHHDACQGDDRQAADSLLVQPQWIE